MRKFSTYSALLSRLTALLMILFTATTISLPSVHAQTAKNKVNVNTADLATLETLPGVGPTVAQRIIDGRPYKSLTDLENVKGLGKTKVEAMKDQVTFGSTSATKSKSTKSTSGKANASQPETGSKPAPLPATGRSSTSGKININTASAEELDKLYGIGTTKAHAIIDYRNEHGKFQSIEDIMKVNGIKEGEFDKIKDQITVR